jgi:hypothetical protein
MRKYEVELDLDKVIIYADEIKFHSSFLEDATKLGLILFQGNRVVGVFRKWQSLIDLGEYLPSQVNEK